MSSRRPHHKSRNGCSQCKARRIKCDEKKPCCGNCSRHSLQCSFFSITPISLFSQPRHEPAALNDRQTLPRPALSSNVQLPDVALPPILSYDPLLSSDTFSIDDLSLLHHFINSTVHTVAEHPIHQRIWLNVIVPLGFSHDYLIHSILAVSALDQAHNCPSSSSAKESFLLAATRHQAIAARSFQTSVTDVTRDNVDALFAFSTLTCCYSFGAPHEFHGGLGTSLTPNAVATTSGYLTPLPSEGSKSSLSVHWLRLLRGVLAILQPGVKYVEQGPLGALLHPGFFEGVYEAETAEEKDIDGRLSDLQRLWNRDFHCDKASSNECMITPKPEDVVLYDKALECLRQSWLRMSRSSPEIARTDPNRPYIASGLVWLWVIPSAFVDLLECGEPGSLVLLAHYGVLNMRLQGFWWSECIGEDLIQAVDEILDPCFKPWIEWPLNELNQRKGEKCAR